MKDNHGFTLVELLAVLALLGVILIIVVPSISTLLKDSKEKETTARQELITSEVSLFIETNSRITKNFQEGLCSYDMEYLYNNPNFTNKDILYDSNNKLVTGCVTYDKDKNEVIFTDTCLQICG